MTRRTQLRIMGFIVLFLGIGGAILLDRYGSQSLDISADPSLTGFYRPDRRQIGMLYGKEILIFTDLWQDLRQPGTEAIIIALISALIAFVCFYFARLLPKDDKTE
jgi:hypothetical protein